MDIINKILKKIKGKELLLDSEDVVIKDCIIEELDLSFTDFLFHFHIENCIIDSIGLHNTRFHEGFSLIDCIIKDKIQYEMGGHNQKEIRIEGNVFKDVFIFLDCIFEENLVVKNNIFLRECTLLNPYNTIERCAIEGNIGKMDNLRFD